MPRKPQQPRARATVDAIIEAGFRCVAKDGLANTSVRQIIETAGVSPGSFYEYFENKDAVLKAMLERFLTDTNPPISFERFSEGLALMVGHFVAQENRLRAEQEGR